MSSSEIAYVGPSVMTSVANVRETPYLMSSQVMGVPSSNVTPSLRVNVQVFAPSDDVPVSLARSGTRPVATSPSGLYLYAVRVRCR